MKPKFLKTQDALKIHNDQIDTYGGMHGIRDMGLLESALGVPSVTYGGEFLNSSIYEMAASYLFHIVKNHPFVDGNKRAGTIAAFTFLEINGYTLEPPKDDFINMVLSIAESTASKTELVSFIEKWSVPNSDG